MEIITPLLFFLLHNTFNKLQYPAVTGRFIKSTISGKVCGFWRQSWFYVILCDAFTEAHGPKSHLTVSIAHLLNVIKSGIDILKTLYDSVFNLHDVNIMYNFDRLIILWIWTYDILYVSIYYTINSITSHSGLLIRSNKRWKIKNVFGLWFCVLAKRVCHVYFSAVCTAWFVDGQRFLCKDVWCLFLVLCVNSNLL